MREDRHREHDLQRRKAGNRTYLQNVVEHRALKPEAPEIQFHAAAARQQIPRHDPRADRERHQRAGRDAAHAELRNWPKAKTEHTAKQNLKERRVENDRRRQLHVAGAAQQRRQSVHDPWQHGAAEEYLRVPDRLTQDAAPAAQCGKQIRPEDQHPDHEGQTEANPDHQRVHGKRGCTLGVVGAQRARNG